MVETLSCIPYFTYNDEEITSCFRDMQNGEEFILYIDGASSSYIFTGFSANDRVIHLTSSNRFNNRGSIRFYLGTNDEELFYKVKEAY